MQGKPGREGNHLDHFKMGDPELCGMLIDEGCHDCVETVAVQYGTSPSELVGLQRNHHLHVLSHPEKESVNM